MGLQVSLTSVSESLDEVGTSSAEPMLGFAFPKTTITTVFDSLIFRNNIFSNQL
jgi:hypothetical protein